MGEIYDFTDGRREVPADEFIENNKGVFDRVMMIGFDTDGDECFGANGLTVMECVYLLEYIKADLLERYK